MKKTILSFFATAITLCAFADGVIQNNTAQTGSTSFTAATGLVISNTFPVPFTCQPVVTTYSTATNNSPFTVGTVTTTGFTLTVTAAGTTNATVIWNAFAGYPRIQFGTNAVTGGTPVTNTFSPAYAYNPVVTVSGAGQGTNNIVSAVATTTQLIINSVASQNVEWQVIGISFSPGVNTVTY